MIPIGTVLGASTVAAFLTEGDPLYGILTVFSVGIGIVCLSSFVITRMIRIML